MKDAYRKVEYVFHVAAVTSPPEFENLIGEGFETNVVGTYNVLAFSAVEGVERITLASSSLYTASHLGQRLNPTSLIHTQISTPSAKGKRDHWEIFRSYQKFTQAYVTETKRELKF
jgi:nucleoside-diphosphate-sugar epimerase